MSTQVTIRVSDEALAYVDGLVHDGRATSRANAFDKLANAARRRAIAERDALIYAREGEDPEVVEFSDAAYAARFGRGPGVGSTDRAEMTDETPGARRSLAHPGQTIPAPR